MYCALCTLEDMRAERGHCQHLAQPGASKPLQFRPRTPIDFLNSEKPAYNLPKASFLQFCYLFAITCNKFYLS